MMVKSKTLKLLKRFRDGFDRKNKYIKYGDRVLNADGIEIGFYGLDCGLYGELSFSIENDNCFNEALCVENEVLSNYFFIMVDFEKSFNPYLCENSTRIVKFLDVEISLKIKTWFYSRVFLGFEKIGDCKFATPYSCGLRVIAYTDDISDVDILDFHDVCMKVAEAYNKDEVVNDCFLSLDEYIYLNEIAKGKKPEPIHYDNYSIEFEFQKQ